MDYQAKFYALLGSSVPLSHNIGFYNLALSKSTNFMKSLKIVTMNHVEDILLMKGLPIRC